MRRYGRRIRGQARCLCRRATGPPGRLRLYAERGLYEVSNPQIAEAAGQANNSAVSYHFGSRRDLITAISATHATDISARAAARIGALEQPARLRDWITCVVRPYTDHLAGLGVPSWYARFTAQATSDSALSVRALYDEALEPVLSRAFAAIRALTPAIAEPVAALREDMVRLMVVHTCAEHERTAAQTRAAVDWELIGDALVDAAAAVFAAPIGHTGEET